MACCRTGRCLNLSCAGLAGISQFPAIGPAADDEVLRRPPTLPIGQDLEARTRLQLRQHPCRRRDRGPVLALERAPLEVAEARLVVVRHDPVELVLGDAPVLPDRLSVGVEPGTPGDLVADEP